VLVLSRKVGEKLILSDEAGMEAVISVQRMSGNRVTLGIEAPGWIKVIRGELPRRTSMEQIVAEANATPKKGHEHEPLINFDGRE
jgi:carbon storage regulator CsrA